MPYEIIGAKDHVSLTAAVSRKLDEGWGVSGSPFSVKGSFYQCVTKEDELQRSEGAEIPQPVLDEISSCIFVVAGECSAMERMGLDPEFQKGEIAGFKTALRIFGYSWDGHRFVRTVHIGVPQGGVLARKMQEFLSIKPDTQKAEEYIKADNNS